MSVAKKGERKRRSLMGEPRPPILVVLKLVAPPKLRAEKIKRKLELGMPKSIMPKCHGRKSKMVDFIFEISNQ